MKKNMRFLNVVSFIVTVLLLFTGCATAPLGPTIQVMPAPGKPFAKFQTESEECQSWAFQKIGGQEAVDRINANAVLYGIIGGAIGAGIGALTGASWEHGHRSSGWHAAHGAALGAGIGTAAGAAHGATASAYSSQQLQMIYDDAYAQCMYSKGNQVPGPVQEYDREYYNQEYYNYDD
ncbi:MAG: glycine zipper family protein [Smithella sp.]